MWRARHPNYNCAPAQTDYAGGCQVRVPVLWDGCQGEHGGSQEAENCKGRDILFSFSISINLNDTEVPAEA